MQLQALLNVFHLVPGKPVEAIGQHPASFNGAELLCLKHAVDAYCDKNPSIPQAKSVQFKINTLVSIWQKFVKEHQ